MSPDYGLQIADEFENYLKTGDEKLIQKYSIKELKMAISLLSPHYNKNKLWYREIEHRIEELNNLERLKKVQQGKTRTQWREKSIDKIIAFVCGLSVGMLFNLI